MQCVEVTWDDHTFHFGEWANQNIMTMVTCGFLVHETKKIIAVALTRREDGQYAEIQVIDKRMVRNIVRHAAV